ncbi:MAG TPA: glycosyltransferase family 9 protein [Gaiellales bacterium]|jgi:ADP-heptose:LPS heptosyltransferase
MRRIVVLRALGLGDFLTAVPALRALRRWHPRHRITLCTPAGLAPLADLCGAVDEVSDTGPLEPLDPTLGGAALAINLHGRGPESHRMLDGIWPDEMIAFAHPDIPWSAGGPPWREREHEVLRWCRLLESSGVATDPGDLHLRLPDVRRDGRVTVIHPGAASRSRRWPPERFAAVARDESARGNRVVVTGGPRERELARRVAGLAGLPGSAVAAGRTGVLELARLVASAGRLICGDTGVAHLATALQTPAVLLFGPVSPELWGPLDTGRHRVLWAGQLGDPHGETPDSGLLRIQVEDVLDALGTLPAPRSFIPQASGARTGHGV